MRHLIFHFDVVSPYAYLAFERLPQVLEGLSVDVSYRPVLFAALLKAWGQRGPAEIVPKRAWTYRQVLWLSERHGIDMQLPARHPFNPLGLLRLAWATTAGAETPSRYVCERVLRHAWCGGAGADDPNRLAALAAELAPSQDHSADEIKARLRESTAEAAASGVFGVPTVLCEGRLFWGLDGLEMLAGWLRCEPGIDDAAWAAVDNGPIGATRRV